MATNFPTSLDSLTNPTATSTLSSPSHSAQHADANDAIEALEAKVGVNNSAVTTSLDYKVRNPELVGGGARPLLTGGAYIDGTNGLVLSGLSGNYASTPDSAALSITGDIDIKCKVTMTDWTPAATTEFVSKWASGQTTFLFRIISTGALRLTWSTNNSDTPQATSTVATGFADGSTKWVRATVDVDDGSGNHLVKFYTSDDGTTWTQLGTTVTTAGTTGFYDSTAPVQFGSWGNGASGLLNGTIHRAIVQSAYDTADNTTNVVFDADFEAEAADTLAFTEDSSNAATVSVTTTRYTVGIPNWFMSSVTTQSHSVNTSFFSMFQVTRAIDVDMLAMEVTTGPASAATVKAGIWALDDNMNVTGSVLVDFGSFTVDTSATGPFYKQITPVTLPPGQYVLVTNSSVTLTVRAFRGSPTFSQLTMNAAPFQVTHRATTANSTFPGSLTTWTAVSLSTVPAYSTGLLRWKAS